MLSSLPSNLLYHRWVLNIKHWRKYQFGRNKYWWVGAKKYNPANHAELAKKTVSSSAAAAGWRGRDGCLLSVAPKVRARWFYEKREIHSRKILVGMEVAVPIPSSSSFYSSSWWPYPSPPSPSTQPARWGVCLNFFTMETSMFTITTRTSWNLKSMLSIDEDGPTFSFDATIRFQWKGILYVRLRLFCDHVESRQPQEQYATYLQQVELFMKIPTAECINERRRKNLS